MCMTERRVQNKGFAERFRRLGFLLFENLMVVSCPAESWKWL